MGKVDGLGSSGSYAHEAAVSFQMSDMLGKILAVDIHISDEANVERVPLNEVKYPPVVFETIACLDNDYPGHSRSFC